MIDEIEIVRFETDGGVRLGRNRPTAITELTYCEWRRNGAEEFATATDRSFTKTGEGEWDYIPNDVRRDARAHHRAEHCRDVAALRVRR